MLDQHEEAADAKYVDASASGTGTNPDDVKIAESQSTPSRPRCKYCLQSFATNGTLKIHVRDQHGENIGELKHIPCLEHGCEFVGRYIDDLIKHLQGRHGRHFTIENHTFQSREEFEIWKKTEETATNSSYLSISGRHRLAHGDERVYFVCSLSDYFRPRGKRNRKFDSETRSAYCTSKMVFTITPVGTGFRYAVAYTKEHYGHVNIGDANTVSTPHPPSNVGSLFANLGQSCTLSDTERALIELLLKRGISPSAIIEQLRIAGAGSTSARLNLATVCDLRAALRKEVTIAQRALEVCADERSLLNALADLKRAARTLMATTAEQRPTGNALPETTSAGGATAAAESGGTGRRNGSKRKPRMTKARRIEAAGNATANDAASNASASAGQPVSAAASSSSTGVIASSSCATTANLHLSNLMPPTQIQIGSSAYYGAPYHAHPPANAINWTDFMNI